MRLAEELGGAFDLGERFADLLDGVVVAGWFVFGIVGAAVALFYLVGPRKRLNAREYSRRY